MLIRAQETWVCKINRNNARLHFHDQCLLQSASVYLSVHQPCLHVRTHRPILIVAMETECCQRSPRSKRASSSLCFHFPPGAPVFPSAVLYFYVSVIRERVHHLPHMPRICKILVKPELNLTQSLRSSAHPHSPQEANGDCGLLSLTSTFLWTCGQWICIKYGASSFLATLSSPCVHRHAWHLYPTLFYFCVFPGWKALWVQLLLFVNALHTQI